MYGFKMADERGCRRAYWSLVDVSRNQLTVGDSAFRALPRELCD